MTILEKIIAHKRREVQEAKLRVSLQELQNADGFLRQPVSLRDRVQRGSGIIAEVKKRSPSQGMIKKVVHVPDLAAGYVSAGVSAISILTDQTFFGGSQDDLAAARKAVSCPILRKEFILDPYQIVESKAIGADAILLLASVLKPLDMKHFVRIAHDIGLEVLAEAHNQAELECCLAADPEVVGINNRSLHDFSISLDVSRRLAPRIPEHICKISESGIQSASEALELRKVGYQGFLIGQTFMQDDSPAEAARNFIREMREKKELA